MTTQGVTTDETFQIPLEVAELYEARFAGLVVPAALPDQPAYRRFVDVAAKHIGPEARSLLGAYWSCGDLDELCGLARGAGLVVESARTHVGTARFGSIDDFVRTEVESSPLAARLDAGAYESLRAACQRVLTRFFGGRRLAPGTAARARRGGQPGGLTSRRSPRVGRRREPT